MKSTRIKKYKKRFPVIFFLVKLVCIWYLIVISISYLTSNTAANFNETKRADSKISAGFWDESWDGSSLAFVTKGNQNIKACEPVTIAVELKNEGDGDMLKDSIYDVYYIENGNPEKHGEKLELLEEEGVIKALKSGEAAEITYEASKPGVYAFLAKQHIEHPDKENTWSKWVIVNCPSANGVEPKEESSSSIDDKTKGDQKQNHEEESRDEADINGVKQEMSNEGGKDSDKKKVEDAGNEEKEQEVDED